MQIGNSGPLGADDASDPEAKWWWRLGHAAPWLLALFWLIYPLALVTGLWITTPMVLVMFAIVVASIRHDLQTLCMRCLRDQPDDGAEREARGVWKLFYYHVSRESIRNMSLILGIPIIGWFASSFIGHTGIGAVLALVCGALIGWDWYAYHTHRRLQSWCRYCKDPDDDPDPVPERDPDPSMTKNA